MALTKQEIVRQIAQGKIQTALEGLVQLSGSIRDKELQQRCILLYSQLSQLKGSFGAGTLDNKTYQLELNRITDAALQAANELPATMSSYQQQTNRQHTNQPPAGSVWKTWGILLTGAVGIVLVLVVIGLIMNEGNGDLAEQNYRPNTDNSETALHSERVSGQPSAQNFTSSNVVSNPPAEPVRNNAEDSFVGNWNGTASVSGIPFGYMQVNLMSNRQFIAYAVDAYDGSRMESDRGTWSLLGSGMLRLNSNSGAYEVHHVAWSNADAFQARLVEASNAAMIGMDVSFARAY